MQKHKYKRKKTPNEAALLEKLNKYLDKIIPFKMIGAKEVAIFCDFGFFNLTSHKGQIVFSLISKDGLLKIFLHAGQRVFVLKDAKMLLTCF